MMKRYLFALAIGLAPSWLMADPIFDSRAPERVLPGLERLISEALGGSDAMIEQALRDAESEGRRGVSDSRVLPSLKAGVELREEQVLDPEPGGDERRQRLIYNVTLSQPLFHWGARQAEKRIGALGYQMDRIDAEVAAQGAVNLARRSYLNLVASRQERAFGRESLERKRAAFALQRQRVESGRAGANTAEELERELRRLELESERAELAFGGQVYDFAAFLNVEESTLLAHLDETVPPVEPLAAAELLSLEATIPDRLEDNENLVKLRKLAEAGEEELRIVNASLRPKLNAVLGLSQNGLDVDGIRREEELVYAGLAVDWNIFDGFATAGERKQALSRLQRNLIAAENLRASLARSLRVDLRSLDLSGKALALDEESLNRQTAELADAEDKLVRGQLAEDRLAELRVALQRARISIQRARSDYLMQVCFFASRLGLDPSKRR